TLRTLRPLKLRGGKGVAACNRAGAEAGIEPAFALLRAAMREGIRDRVAAGASLQRVVAHRGRRAQRGCDVARLDEWRLALALQHFGLAIGPHAGGAIGLALHL